MNEKARIAGRQAAYRHILRQCLAELPEGSEHRWQLERGAAVAALRRVCADHGDNDWPDNLSLADVIEKHLRQQLDRECDERL